MTKADGTPRVCVDFRLLNAVTRGPDRFPLPKIDDMINKLRKANFFTCLDLLSGFWQQAMHPASIEKTSFVTQDAQYEFTRMPFGLKNAGSSFSRMIVAVLGSLGCKRIVSYVDDICIWAENGADHEYYLRYVLTRLRKFNLRICEEVSVSV